jgi:hypothetical protein
VTSDPRDIRGKKVDLSDLQKGDIVYDRDGINEAPHWHYVVVRADPTGADTLDMHANRGRLSNAELSVMWHLTPKEYGDRSFVRKIKAGELDNRFDWHEEEPLPSSESGISLPRFSSLLSTYLGTDDEGWHRVYKKFGSALANENYRWKRKVMKRFGHNRKAVFRAELRRPSFLEKISKESDWKGGSFTMPVSLGDR